MIRTLYRYWVRGFLLFLLSSTTINVSWSATKMEGLRFLRSYYQKEGYRRHDLKPDISVNEMKKQLTDEGFFLDLRMEEERLWSSKENGVQYQIGNFNEKALSRLWAISASYRTEEGSVSSEFNQIRSRFWRSLRYYCQLEVNRPNVNARFHASCFLIPRIAVNLYFTFLQEMDSVELGMGNAEMKEVNRLLRTIGLQAWTQPYRHDQTDQNPFSIDRFRNHVWWVGGNALGYRALLPSAVMESSEAMTDLLVEIARRSIDVTSHTTFQDAFWTEGITADGAGWGHGKQCLVWGYPIDGTNGALGILNSLRGTPWETPLDQRNKDAIFTFLRGASFFYYKGYIPPCYSRASTKYYEKKEVPIPYEALVRQLVLNFSDSFSSEEMAELRKLQEEIANHAVFMDGMPLGMYQGSRYFYCNDKMVKKNQDYMITVNMASNRVDGLESAYPGADGLNFFTCDGMTLLQRTGHEYHDAMGAWQMSALPGITARQVQNRELSPIVNWRGYTSRYSYAAGATNGGENAVCGFIFEKIDAESKSDDQKQSVIANRKGNDLVFDVRAHKGYFMLKDYMVCLGAGITNLNTNSPLTICTTIDQTALSSNVTIRSSNRTYQISPDEPSRSYSFEMKDKKPIWIHQQGGFSYLIFPQSNTTVDLFAGKRDCDWVEKYGPNRVLNPPPTQSILQIGVNHGPKASNSNYAYAVYCGKTQPDKHSLAKVPFNVISNTSRIQAVASSDYSVVQALFFDESAILGWGKKRVSVSSPLALMLERRDGGCQLTLCDALQDPKVYPIEVKVNWQVSGENVRKEGDFYIITIPIRAKEAVGRPISFFLNEQ